MARLELTIQTIGRAGVDIGGGQAVLAADDAQFANDGATVLKLDNTTGAAIIITFQTPQTVLESPALPVAEQTFSVPATSERWLGPFPAATFNDGNGKLLVDSPTDGVNMTAVRIGSGG